MKPRMLYLMHVPWSWIKQRPHFVAIELANYFDVTVVARPSSDKQLNAECEKVIIRNIGVAGESVFIRGMNYILLVLWINYCCFFKKIKYLWITDPRLIKFYQKIIVRKPLIIYDCMDNTSEFQEIKHSLKKQDKFLKQEQYVLNNAHLITVSSETLKNILCEKHHIFDLSKVIVVNNALDKNFIKQNLADVKFNELCSKLKTSGNKLIIYSGTIDTWMQFDWLKELVCKTPDIAVVLIGPNVAGFLSDNERLVLFGAIGHNYLFNALKNADAFIMPFKTNKLIESVDPVKVYEYLVCDRPIILPYYSELDKFAHYESVHFYETFEQFKNIVSKCLFTEQTKNEVVDTSEFLASNAWSYRVSEIYSKLNKCS